MPEGSLGRGCAHALGAVGRAGEAVGHRPGDTQLAGGCPLHPQLPRFPPKQLLGRGLPPRWRRAKEGGGSWAQGDLG